MKSWTKPTPEAVSRALALIARLEHRRYFFDKLENPLWLDELRARGLFKSPPPISRDPANGILRVPPWPESGYLSRMAAYEPVLVRDIILEMQETDNWRVHDDLARATLLMPAAIAAHLTTRAISWAEGQIDIPLSESLATLICNLSRGDFKTEAMAIATTLLDVIPSTTRAPDSAESEILPPATATTRFHSWHYKEIIKRILPVFVESQGLDAIKLFCRLLVKALRISERVGQEAVADDYSYVWRPRIETGRRGNDDLNSILVDAIRDTSELLIQHELASVKEIVGCLDEFRFLVFIRIGLFLAYTYPQDSKDLIASRLPSKLLSERHELRYEYAKLLEAGFEYLDGHGQQTVLGIIDEGPELTKHRIPDDEIHYHKGRWQRDLLALIEGHLPEQWKQHLMSLIHEYGAAVRPEPPYQMQVSSWAGYLSPKNANEVHSMSLPLLFNYLRDWAPEDGLYVPSRDGLAQVLKEVVSNDSKTYTMEACQFKTVHPVYVTAFIRGVAEDLKKHSEIDWAALLDLCRWIAEQPSAPEGRDTWEQAKSETIRFLSSSLERSPSILHFSLRSEIWQVLEPLTRHPDPTPERERRSTHEPMDSVSTAINSIRGTAIEAAIRYALWIRRNLEGSPDAKELVAHGFNEIPEVRTVLETHLDPSLDCSSAIRSIYGQWFPWLALLDNSWAKERISTIFTPKEPFQSLGKIAWDTYLLYCPAFDDVFTLLRNLYKNSADQLRESKYSERGHRDPVEKFAEHLMIYYWRGKVDNESEDSPFRSFWENAPPMLRGAALEFIGRSIINTKDEIPHDIVELLVRLWESRTAHYRMAGTSNEASLELAAFGWWFSSGKCEPLWSLANLEFTLEIGKAIEADHMVVNKLLDYASLYPLEVIKCLTLLVHADLKEWSIYSWREEAGKILAIILGAFDRDAVSAAETLVHELGSRGYREFRSLLSGDGATH